MIIPGFIISLVTFPGVIVHELAHVLFCRLTGTPICEVCYFRIGNPAGYVIHDQPSSVWRHILIGVGPFFLNSLIGLAAGVAAELMHMDLDKMTTGGNVFVWLAVSIAMHSFPSTGDARSIWSAVWSPGSPLSARLLGTPLVVIIFSGALGSFFWLDALYGFLLVFGLPKALLGT